MNHGTRYGYKQGCRCTPCVNANSHYIRGYKRPEAGAVEKAASTLATLAAAFEKADWMQDAACRGMDPDLFFPAHGHQPEKALAVCAGCGVSEECLAHALATGERDGVWGATTGRARRAMKRRAA